MSADSVSGSLGNPQSFNLYAYVHNNPLKLVDPSGHVPQNPEKVNAVTPEGKPFPITVSNEPGSPFDFGQVTVTGTANDPIPVTDSPILTDLQIGTGQSAPIDTGFHWPLSTSPGDWMNFLFIVGHPGYDEEFMRPIDESPAFQGAAFVGGMLITPEAELPEGGFTLYRLITEEEPAANLLSNSARGLAPRGAEIANPGLHQGLSMFDTVEGAASRIPLLEKGGNKVLGIGRFEFAEGVGGVRIDKTMGRGHYTVTGTPSTLERHWTFSLLPPE